MIKQSKNTLTPGKCHQISLLSSSKYPEVYLLPGLKYPEVYLLPGSIYFKVFLLPDLKYPKHYLIPPGSKYPEVYPTWFKISGGVSYLVQNIKRCIFYLVQNVRGVEPYDTSPYTLGTTPSDESSPLCALSRQSRSSPQENDDGCWSLIRKIINPQKAISSINNVLTFLKVTFPFFFK